MAEQLEGGGFWGRAVEGKGREKRVVCICADKCNWLKRFVLQLFARFQTSRTLPSRL